MEEAGKIEKVLHQANAFFFKLKLSQKISEILSSPIKINLAIKLLITKFIKPFFGGVKSKENLIYQLVATSRNNFQLI